MQKVPEERTTPYGLWRYGNDFRRAAVTVYAEHRTVGFMPLYFLLGQSIELSLKAFLLARGLPLNELRRKKYGHNLEKLLNEALERGLSRQVELEQEHVAAINLLGIEYLARQFQYINTGSKVLPEVQLVVGAAEALSRGLEQFCAKATMG